MGRGLLNERSRHIALARPWNQDVSPLLPLQMNAAAAVGSTDAESSRWRQRSLVEEDVPHGEELTILTASAAEPPLTPQQTAR